MATTRKSSLGSVLGFGIPLLLGGYILVDCLVDRHENEQLTSQGVTGVAKVLSFESTGFAVNRNPRLRFRFEVQPDGDAAPFTVDKAIVVTTMEAPRLQVGMSRKVRYLPHDPETLRFED